MNKEFFSQLVDSIERAGAIRKGSKAPSRSVKVRAPDVSHIRGNLGLSQTQFALMIGVSPRTVQNWEQKRREPEGAAKALLLVTDRHPKMVLEALHGQL